MKTMRAKYSGKCRNCGGAIAIDDPIKWSRLTGAIHADCKEFAPVGLACRDPRMQGQVVVTTFADGTQVYRNRKGRCEDAPCCGCCTY